MSTAHYKLHTSHFTFHTEGLTLHSALCTLPTSHCILHTAHCTLHSTPGTFHPAHCTLHTTQSISGRWSPFFCPAWHPPVVCPAPRLCPHCVLCPHHFVLTSPLPCPAPVPNLALKLRSMLAPWSYVSTSYIFGILKCIFFGANEQDTNHRTVETYTLNNTVEILLHKTVLWRKFCTKVVRNCWVMCCKLDFFPQKESLKVTFETQQLNSSNWIIGPVQHWSI